VWQVLERDLFEKLTQGVELIIAKRRDLSITQRSIERVSFGLINAHFQSGAMNILSDDFGFYSQHQAFGETIPAKSFFNIKTFDLRVAFFSVEARSDAGHAALGGVRDLGVADRPQKRTDKYRIPSSETFAADQVVTFWRVQRRHISVGQQQQVICFSAGYGRKLDIHHPLLILQRLQQALLAEASTEAGEVFGA